MTLIFLIGRISIGRFYSLLVLLRATADRRHICIEIRRPGIGRLGHEEEDEQDDDAAEDGDQVKGPFPAEGMRDLADNDGGEEGTAEER